MTRRLSVALSFLGVLCAGCSSADSENQERKRELSEFSKSRATQVKVAKAIEQRAARTDRDPAGSRNLSELNGRWRTGALETDRHLELSFGMDGVVVVDMMTPRGSLASAQGKFVFLPTGPVSVTLASPRPALRPYAMFVVTRQSGKPVIVVDGKNVAIYRM